LLTLADVGDLDSADGSIESGANSPTRLGLHFGEASVHCDALALSRALAPGIGGIEQEPGGSG